MKKFCKSLREHITWDKQFEKEKMKLLIKEQNHMEIQKVSYICK